MSILCRYRDSNAILVLVTCATLLRCMYWVAWFCTSSVTCTSILLVKAMISSFMGNTKFAPTWFSVLMSAGASSGFTTSSHFGACPFLVPYFFINLLAILLPGSPPFRFEPRYVRLHKSKALFRFVSYCKSFSIVQAM